MALTKAAFLAEYEKLKLEATEGSEQPVKRFIEGVRKTLGHAGYIAWDIENDIHARMAWLHIGGVGKPSVPALRRLPEDDDGAA